MILTGKIERKLDLKKGISKAGKEWAIGELLLTTGSDKYTKKVVISCSESLYNSVRVGITYHFDINIESNEYNGKFYTKVNAWKFEVQPTQ
jgi:hypothetical protein